MKQTAPKILLAEDNDVNRALAAAVFKPTGFHVDMVVNGDAAVTAATNDRYDIILMDMKMPVLNGLEATKRLRDAGLTDVPIVALTANVGDADRDECLEAGMNDFLPKPFSPQDLLSLIDRWVTTAREIRPS